jgi:hypothetical protein
MQTLMDSLFQEFQTLVTDMFGSSLPQQDVEFLAGFLLMDFLDQMFGGLGGGGFGFGGMGGHGHGFGYGGW